MACAVDKVCTCTQINDSVQYIESRWEVRVAEILVISSVPLLCTSVLLSFSFSQISCFRFVLRIIVVYFLVEFTKDIGNSFT